MDTGTIIALACGTSIISYAIAIRKNRKPIRWAVAGFLFGFFTVIAICIMPKVEK